MVQAAKEASGIKSVQGLEDRKLHQHCCLRQMPWKPNLATGWEAGLQERVAARLGGAARKQAAEVLRRIKRCKSGADNFRCGTKVLPCRANGSDEQSAALRS